jgi:hypothetical protein
MAKPALDVVRRHEATAPERKVPGRVPGMSTRAKLLGTGIVVGAGLGAYALLRDSRPPGYTLKEVDVELAVTTGTGKESKTVTKTVKVRADHSCFSAIEHYRAWRVHGRQIELVELDENQRILVCAVRAHIEKCTRLVATYEGATLAEESQYKGMCAYTPNGGSAITIQNTQTNNSNFI